jgi:hypothetical protein
MRPVSNKQYYYTSEINAVMLKIQQFYICNPKLLALSWYDCKALATDIVLEIKKDDKQKVVNKIS